MDKTGTLTEGKLSVSGVVPLSTIDEGQLLEVAAAAEFLSEHPIGKAVVNAAKNRGMVIHAAERFSSVPGGGIRAVVAGRSVIAGSPDFLEEQEVRMDDHRSIIHRMSDQGNTVVAIAVEGVPAGLIALADKLKPTAAQAVSRLKGLGCRVVMMTGDNEQVAAIIAREAGIEHVLAGVSPASKAQEVRRLQAAGHRVAMVGDGVNDAPALATADVGIAMGSGTDVAAETAGIIIMTSNPGAVADAILLSRRMIRVVRQNFFWAFLYNVLGIPLAAFGQLNPMIAAVAMAASSVTVVSNSLRLRRASSRT